MEHANARNNQLAFDYALFMIAGSYFEKAVCPHSLWERKLSQAYKGAKTDTQVRMEALCIRYAEVELLPTLPPEIWKQEVSVRLIPTTDGKRTVVQFVGENFILRLQALYRGGKSRVFHELWERISEGEGKCA
ncbi:MAG: hypothetical protein IJ744_01595 [Lachnospiraceae bacterium]|nr:hypothetical protein [Lachnospiraceae bacterium]